ncbi:MAG TPA: tRNA (adenosine(37)-N6)-threonylcarbamoyltransferase complex dimerization subunit type 1 TsaB, partial [Adhaeribacter sp.]|nr:tRNA (adenosine(37)-N6)-threonylcarbamoyltransferase complex dimerization subunit type 1 TsaB [Adhaeribacter sp.]
MALLLSLETSSTICSVALLLDGRLLGSSELRLEKSHSSHITVLAQQLLANTSFTEKDLSAVVVSGGPGSYTGLRIGTSTAKGLCYALDIPLLAVSTLQVLAWQAVQVTARAESFKFCPILVARRMEVYTGLYTAGLQEIMPDQALVLEPDNFKEVLEEGPVLFFGSGAAKWENFMEPHANAFFLRNVMPEAAAVAELGWKKFQAGQFENTAYYEPFYV